MNKIGSSRGAVTLDAHHRLSLGVLLAIHFVLSFKVIQIFGLPFMDFVFLSESYAVGILSLGLVLGLLGSFIAIGRFFKF
jgi:hypothetical protein